MKPLADNVLRMNWGNINFYKHWLAQSYYYTRHSTRMLAYAAGWTGPEKQNYYRRSVQHIQEEQGHDLIALNDLKLIGGSILEHPELSVTRALWEPQFYKIQKNPTTLLGYILALEVLALQMCQPMYEMLLKNYPAEACRFVKVHAEDDPEHVEHALAQIERCSLEEREEIIANFHQTRDMYSLFLQAIQKLE